MVPENITPYHLAYDIINDHPNHKGACQICGKETNWNEKTQKYFRICKDPKCKEAIQKQYQERMLRVHNKIYLTDSPEHLEKMLSGRRISGTYTWSDGKKFTYTGTYEKKFLEFLDKTMEYDSRDIICPGPTLEYIHRDGKKHMWITDFLILPYNLIIEIKDGGDNKNNKPMFDTRQRTLYKEKMITNQGVYSYARVTNNNFGQFLSIIAELKMNVVEDKQSPIFRIHEDTEFVSPEEHQADQIDRYTKLCADIWLGENAGQFQTRMVHNPINGIFSDPNTTMDISAFSILTPVNEDIETFTENIKLVEESLKLSYVDGKTMNGFYIDPEQPELGYLIGMEV